MTIQQTETPLVSEEARRRAADDRAAWERDAR